MKLALGTAQFGLSYGIANRTGQVACAEGAAIVQRARTAGIHTLDTAIAYGDSEQRLGAIGVSDWDIVSKLPDIPDGCADVGGWVAASVRESLNRLGVDRLYGLLLHRPGQLLEGPGAALYRALQSVKDQGLAERIGVSIYDPSELELLTPRFAIDILQAPVNLFDRRLIESGWLARLAGEGVEVHARSVFLQGLLLMPRETRPQKFSRWGALLGAYDAWLDQTGTNPMQACLSYVLGFPEITTVIVGVDSARQLEELIEASAGAAPPAPPELRCRDVDLLNPSRWATL